MAVELLLAVSAVVVAVETSDEARAAIVIENEHLVVEFLQSDAGPRLGSITHRTTGETFCFQNVEEIALAVVRPETVHDPKTQVKYRLQDAFQFQEITSDEQRTAVILRFAGDLVDVQIVYRLQADAAVLRKETICTARPGGAYVTGVTHWMIKPVDLSPAWPKSGTYGQPAVVFGKSGGYFATLEWPRAKMASIEGDIHLAYRPGLNLSPGESCEAAAGSIGFFQTTGSTREEQLEAARRSFFDHVADRVEPSFPFPVKFTTWGPWLGQMREDRILRILDDLAYVGTDLLHLDAGWQHPEYPYSKRLPEVRDVEDRTWDCQMIQTERLPHGLLPVAEAAKQRGMKVSLWFDACGNVFVREDEQWATRDQDGKPVYSGMWEQRWPQLPRQSLATEYGDRLEEFVLGMMDRYDLGGIMFDDNHYTPDFGGDRRSLAGGGNALDVQLGTILDILDEGNKRRPGLYRFYCSARSWPWALLHATHIHAGDPGMSPTMVLASSTDHPARALAFERRLAWQRHYDNFVPPWGIKGDIAGWSVQQRSPIPINLKHTGQLIPTGEGWTQNMFTCFATTAVRDIRFSFRQMPAYDRDILREWLAWDRQRSHFIINCRPFLKDDKDPNQGLAGYSHVGNGRGVIYLFNNSFEQTVATLTLGERLGFRPQDQGLSAYLVYPVKAPLGAGTLSYGQIVRLPIVGKDCVVIEVGLDSPETLTPYADYERTAATVHRSYATVFRLPASDLFDAVRQGSLRLEVGDTRRDRILASQIIETLGAVAEERLSLDRCCAVAANKSRCRIIVGTHEGLCEHNEIGRTFCETLYDRYVRWNDHLYSAPLCVALPGDGPPTFCLIAPRPEQLARLANDLTSEFLKQTKVSRAVDNKLAQPRSDFVVEIDLPRDQPVLRFRPVVRQHGHMPLPGDLEMIRFQIEAERDGERAVLWEEDIPPFGSPGRGPDPASFGSAQWWEDRVISIADLAGQRVRFHFRAQHIDGQGHPQLTIGFTRVAALQ